MAARVLARLARMSPTSLFLTATGLVLVALLIGGWFGALLLLAVGAVPAAVLVRIWPQIGGQARAARVAMLLLLLALAVAQIGP